MEKTLIKGPQGEDIFKEDYTDEYGNIVKDGRVLAACGEWFEINPWKNEEIANAPMDQWFSLDPYWIEKGKEKCLGKYWMNKKGEIKSTIYGHGKGKIWKPIDFKIHGYGKKYYIFQDSKISIIYSYIFLLNDNPQNKKIVDHINGDSLNNSYINLRWVSSKENRLNQNKNSRRNNTIKKSRYYYAKYDLNGIFISWVDNNTLSNNYKKSIFSSIQNDSFGRGKFDNHYWELYTNISKDYVEKYGYILPNRWKKSIDYTNLYANPNGCLFNKDTGIICVGSKVNKNYYCFYDRKNKKSIITSRLIYSILNNMSLEDIENLEIDHIKGFSNNISNLRLCTHIENMKNSETKKKLCREVVIIDIKTLKIEGVYSSIKNAATYLGVKGISVKQLNKNGGKSLIKGKLVAYKGEEEERVKSFLNDSKSIPKIHNFWKDKNNRKSAASSCESVREYRKKYRQAYDYSSQDITELREFFPNESITLPCNEYSDKSKRFEVALKCKNKGEYRKKYKQAYRISLLNPGEIEEFFNARNKK